MASNNEQPTCARCGSPTANGTLKAGRDEANVVIAGVPDSFLGVVPYTTSPVGVRVCKTCGHIDLYARALRDLLRVDPSGGG